MYFGVHMNDFLNSNFYLYFAVNYIDILKKIHIFCAEEYTRVPLISSIVGHFLRLSDQLYN